MHAYVGSTKCAKVSQASRPLGGFSPVCIHNELLHPRHIRPVLAYRVDTSKQPRPIQEMATVSNGPPACLHATGRRRAEHAATKWDLDTLGIEPRASRMLSGCDTTTPCARRHLFRNTNGMLNIRKFVNPAATHIFVYTQLARIQINRQVKSTGGLQAGHTGD